MVQSGVCGFWLFDSVGVLDRGKHRSPARILPAARHPHLAIYLLSLTVALVVTGVIGGGITFPDGSHFDPPTRLQVIASFMMLQTILAAPIAIDDQLWTLAVEWWLYMAAPLLNKLPTWLVAVLAAASLCYDIHTQSADAGPTTYSRSIIALAWYWLIGFMYYRYPRQVTGYILLFLPVIIAKYFGIFTGKAIMIGLFGVALCSFIKLPRKVIPAMHWLGDLSYPIYCLHPPIMALCVFWHIYSSTRICLIVFCVSILSLHLLDFPVRRWARDKNPDLEVK